MIAISIKINPTATSSKKPWRDEFAGTTYSTDKILRLTNHAFTPEARFYKRDAFENLKQKWLMKR